ncbi:unnamed protein product [Nippostrongylus brasiliensis]|uniref:Uncharacterized protein n=1 Tax=Nippostrongylus brasiliensis TaxID=27835 RepID=A0A0N4YYT9_NIPBR|nr:unnamed protein product [Nippostrongylus brasiliensis]
MKLEEIISTTTEALLMLSASIKVCFLKYTIFILKLTLFKPKWAFFEPKWAFFKSKRTPSTFKLIKKHNSFFIFCYIRLQQIYATSNIYHFNFKMDTFQTKMDDFKPKRTFFKPK